MGNKMEKKKTVRNSNIELLRILAIGGGDSTSFQ